MLTALMAVMRKGNAGSMKVETSPLVPAVGKPMILPSLYPLAIIRTVSPQLMVPGPHMKYTGMQILGLEGNMKSSRLSHCRCVLSGKQDRGVLKSGRVFKAESVMCAMTFSKSNAGYSLRSNATALYFPSAIESR